MVDYQTISIVMTGIGMIIALTYYALQIRNQNRTRQAQLFMQFFDTFNNKEFAERWLDVLWNWKWSDLDDFWEKYGPEKNMDSYSSYVSVAMYFSGLGILVKKGLIDVDLVYQLSPTALKSYWEKTEPIVKSIREMWKSPHLQGYFEYIYNEIQKLDHTITIK